MRRGGPAAPPAIQANFPARVALAIAAGASCRPRPDESRRRTTASNPLALASRTSLLGLRLGRRVKERASRDGGGALRRRGRPARRRGSPLPRRMDETGDSCGAACGRARCGCPPRRPPRKSSQSPPLLDVGRQGGSGLAAFRTSRHRRDVAEVASHGPGLRGPRRPRWSDPSGRGRNVASAGNKALDETLRR